MNLLLDISSFDSGFFVGVAGRPAVGDDTGGRATAGAAVPTGGAGLAPEGVPTVGLEPTGAPTVGLVAGVPEVPAG